jgi:N-acetylneuraminic acid mutarotase
LNQFMKKLFLLALAPVLVVAAAPSVQELAPVPSPVSNNAVTAVNINRQILIYSFMGLGPERTWNSVSNAAYALNLKYNKWTTIRSGPGSGRLGAVAASAQDQVFLIGGFVPDQSGLQAVVPDLSIYDPIGLRWYRGPDLPIPVRDAVAGVFRDRYIYVVGGLARTGPTNEVQVYDVLAQHWLRATPYPGEPVFGHAGTVVGDAIIYVDGAKKNAAGNKPGYVASDECWLGKIDHKDPKKIQWSKLPPHPGSARYRIAAGGSDKDVKAYFAGGSDAIYDYSGIGLDGKPAEPSAEVFAFNLRNNSWEPMQNAPNPTMDHRGLVATPDGLILVGGMASGPKVVANTTVLPKGK